MLTSTYSSILPPNNFGVVPTNGVLPILLFLGFGGNEGGLQELRKKN